MMLISTDSVDYELEDYNNELQQGCCWVPTLFENNQDGGLDVFRWSSLISDLYHIHWAQCYN